MIGHHRKLVLQTLLKEEDTMDDTQELIAKQELGTYLNGLRDALEMTKPEIRKAIKIIEEDTSWMID